MHVCMNFYRHSSIKPVFFSPVVMKGLPCYNTTQAGQSERPSSSPALSLWPLKNKWSFKYFPVTGPPFFLQAGLLVKHVCLRCFVKELLFHPHSKTQSTQLACKKNPLEKEKQQDTVNMTKLNRHISFIMSFFDKN